MDIVGEISNISLDYKTGLPRIEITAAEKIDLAIAEQMQGKLAITIKKYRKKRSLDANAYFHVLAGKIAEKMSSSLTEVKNHLLSEYGQYEVINGQLVPMIIRDDVEWMKLDTVHLKPTAATRTLDDGNLYRVYYLIRGSHTYDTAEMSRLIDSTVEEAKALGIETATPDEIRRMKELYEKHHR